MLFFTGILGLLVAGASVGMVLDRVVRPEDEEDLPDPDLDPPHAAGAEGAPDMIDTVTTAVFGGPERDPSPPVGPGDDVAWGGPQDERIDAGAGADRINGYEGADTITGGTGDDSLWGGAGDDLLDGEAGDDSLHGNEGDDSLIGGAGADGLYGGPDDDTLLGGAGDDTLDGGSGNDLLLGADGDDVLCGGSGGDTLIGGPGRDELNGNVGDDLLVGLVRGGETGEGDLDGGDYLNGGEGADTLMAGSGDWASGGEGGDLFAVGEWSDPDDPPVIADYDRSLDQIAVVYDPDLGITPEVTIEASDRTADASWIMLNGVRLAEVLSAADLQVEDVMLVTPGELAYL